jgi:chitin disaccharide deacetylase
MRLLIVNADDFGMSPGVSAGILEAHANGIVTSTSMLVNTPFSQAAAVAASEHPDLSVGLHACLTHESGAWAINPYDTESCRTELVRQFEDFTELMQRPPTHLDSHHHVHRDPRMRPLFSELAQAHSLILRENTSVRFLGSFYGQWDDTAHPEQISTESLMSMVELLEPGVTELSCHPGRVDSELRSPYRQEREIELATLCAPEVPQKLAENGIELIGFNSVCGSVHR